MTPQYRTIASSAGWLDASSRGRLRFEGPDAPAFLHALVSNDVAGLSIGRGLYSAWLTPQGRMITDLRVLRDPDGLVAEVPGGMAAALATRFDQLIFAENVRVVDQTPQTRAIVVFGPHAAQAVGAATGASPAGLAELPVLGHGLHGTFRVVRTDDVALPNYTIWMPTEHWEPVTTALAGTGAVQVVGRPVETDDLFLGLRIEAARPLFGVDMTTDTIPLEAGLLNRAISTTKGCYVGQEVIVRILHRGGGRVVKQLVQFVADATVTEIPATGTKVLDNGRDVGVVTSAAHGPSLGRVVALGYVHRDSAEVGRVVSLGAGVPAAVSKVVA